MKTVFILLLLFVIGDALLIFQFNRYIPIGVFVAEGLLLLLVLHFRKSVDELVNDDDDDDEH